MLAIDTLLIRQNIPHRISCSQSDSFSGKNGFLHIFHQEIFFIKLLSARSATDERLVEPKRLWGDSNEGVARTHKSKCQKRPEKDAPHHINHLCISIISFQQQFVILHTWTIKDSNNDNKYCAGAVFCTSLRERIDRGRYFICCIASHYFSTLTRI